MKYLFLIFLLPFIPIILRICLVAFLYAIGIRPGRYAYFIGYDRKAPFLYVRITDIHWDIDGVFICYRYLDYSLDKYRHTNRANWRAFKRIKPKYQEMIGVLYDRGRNV